MTPSSRDELVLCLHTGGLGKKRKSEILSPGCPSGDYYLFLSIKVSPEELNGATLCPKSLKKT